jgi:hypothetical protein
VGRGRKAIRAYLDGEKTAGHRLQGPDAIAPFLDHCHQRLSDDPYVWATTLFDKVAGPVPSCWLIAPLVVPTGIFGPTVNVTAA